MPTGDIHFYLVSVDLGPYALRQLLAFWDLWNLASMMMLTTQTNDISVADQLAIRRLDDHYQVGFTWKLHNPQLDGNKSIAMTL